MIELIRSMIGNMSIIELIMMIGSIAFFVVRLDANHKASQELINTELAHVTKLMELNHKNLQEDIARLEKKQEESNRIKERLAMQEVMVADIQSLLRSHLAAHDELNNRKK